MIFLVKDLNFFQCLALNEAYKSISNLTSFFFHFTLSIPVAQLRLVIFIHLFLILQSIMIQELPNNEVHTRLLHILL